MGHKKTLLESEWAVILGRNSSSSSSSSETLTGYEPFFIIRILGDIPMLNHKFMVKSTKS